MSGTFAEIPPARSTPLLAGSGIWVKSESVQWTGSAKYRMVAWKLRRAIARGEIRRSSTLTEVTAGSTGVALAHLGGILGLPVELHAYESISASKRRAIEERGGRLIFHPTGTPVPDLLDLVRRRHAAGSHWHLDQYDRASIASSYSDLGAELSGQLRERAVPQPRVFICPVGTGGLIQGVGGVLRNEFPGIRVIALEPVAGAVIDGIRNTEQGHQGAADPYDRSFPDETIRVPRPERLTDVEGVRLGESSTAAFEAARAGAWGPTVVLAPD